MVCHIYIALLILGEMQQRHTDRQQYFSELAFTSQKYFIPYIRNFIDMGRQLSILEIGCGDGGNLLPFARDGHEVVGIDISSNRITRAISFFEKEGAKAQLICADILAIDKCEGRFDLIICHDVIEHIRNKQEILKKMEYFIKPSGIIFIAFPAWQMPFGGHQQICHGRWLSRLPFIHLLPRSLYRKMLSIGGETEECINELMAIKATGITVEHFERSVTETSLEIAGRRLYLINPHYEIKFGLRPRMLPILLSKIPYIRNFLSTSCFYILRKRN